jgi:hypothetical protein
VDALVGGHHRLVAAPAAGGLGVGADRVVGQLEAGQGPTLGGLAAREQLQAAVVPAVGGVGIAQQSLDLLSDSTLPAEDLGADGPVHRFSPDDPPRQPVGERKLPVQAVGSGNELQPWQG